MKFLFESNGYRYYGFIIFGRLHFKRESNFEHDHDIAKRTQLWTPGAPMYNIPPSGWF